MKNKNVELLCGLLLVALIVTGIGYIHKARQVEVLEGEVRELPDEYVSCATGKDVVITRYKWVTRYKWDGKVFVYDGEFNATNWTSGIDPKWSEN